MQTSAILFKSLHSTVHISIIVFIFKHCYSDCRRKLNSIKSESSFLFAWLFVNSRIFCSYGASSLLVKSVKFRHVLGIFGSLSREGVLFCHTCCDKGLRFLRSRSNGRPILELGELVHHIILQFCHNWPEWYRVIAVLGHINNVSAI